MTTRLLVILCAVAFPLALFAQSPTPVPARAPLDENFVLTLSPAGKDGEGLSVIMTSAQTFNISRSGFTFSGTLQRVGGGFRLDFLLETNASAGGTIHTGSSVILTPGEPVQLVKNGDQFYNLRLDHYPPPDAAKPGAGR